MIYASVADPDLSVGSKTNKFNLLLKPLNVEKY
jgi:hypothetical protein